MAHNVLVVANETIGGRTLMDAVRARHEAHDDVRFHLVVPTTRPKHGNIIYDEAVRDAAQVRVDLALNYVSSLGIQATGEVGDADPYTAAMDAAAVLRPDEIIVSTHPVTTSGWLRRDLVDRISARSHVPVEHVVTDLDREGLPFTVTLVIANRTATGEELMQRLRAKAEEDSARLFILVVPQDGKDGRAPANARRHLTGALAQLREAGLLASGMIGDPNPYDATMNALQFYRVDEIVISTLGPQSSGWLRTDLVERVRRVSNLPVEHVLAAEGAPVEAA
ncbi:MAG TPA: hypothetical protein VGV40_01835 [Solirubrobacteraceae bacterium]|nr:hypothetical protein [Solirubrobacteraceae bacterium]